MWRTGASGVAALLLAASCGGDAQPTAESPPTTQPPPSIPIPIGMDQAVTPIAPELAAQMKESGALGLLCFTSRDILYATVDMGLVQGKYLDDEERVEAFHLTRARLVGSLEAAERDLATVEDLDPSIVPYHERLVADVARARAELTALAPSADTETITNIDATAQAMLSIFDFGDYPAREAYRAALRANPETCPS